MNENIRTAKKKNSHPFWKWFWLTFLVVSLAYAWYSFYAPSNEIKWIDTISSNDGLINNSRKYTLVFFTGKWCSPCRIMKREVFSDQEVENVINTNFRPVNIDVDNPKTKNIVEKYKVKVTPTTLILDPEGKVIDYAIGKVEKDKFLKMLNRFIP